MAMRSYRSKSVPSNIKIPKKAKDSIVDLLTRVIPDAKRIEFFYEIFGIQLRDVPTVSFKTKTEISPRVQSDLEGIGLFPAPMGHVRRDGTYVFIISEAWLGR